MLIIYRVPSQVSREHCGVRRRDTAPVRSVLKFPGRARDGGGGRRLAVERFRSIRSQYDGSTSALLNPLIPMAHTASQRLSAGLSSQTGRTLVAEARTAQTALLKSDDVEAAAVCDDVTRTSLRNGEKKIAQTQRGASRNEAKYLQRRLRLMFNMLCC